MSGLKKANLYRLSNDKQDRRLETIPVQFNPASLRLTISNNTEGGQSTGRQQRQYTGNSSTELAFDLVFDSADEDGGGGDPLSVRTKTARVEQFVLAQGSGSGRQSPPRVEFEWGDLSVKGVITSLALDFDLFAADGTALRAKMGVSIKEQDARYELLEAGPGSSREGTAPPPGGKAPATPGSAGGGANNPASNRSALALAGESAADFAARMGLDPAAWRGVAAGLDGTLSLSAGVEIGFNASLSLGAGVGVSAGVDANLGVSLEASLGLPATASASSGAATGLAGGGGGGSGPSAAPGFALSAAGGVSAALETSKIARADSAVGATLTAFAAKGAAGGNSSALGGAARSPAASGAALAVGSAAGVGAGGGSAAAALAGDAAAPSYAPPQADPRATSFGTGVPLRPRITGAAQASAGALALHPYARTRQPPTTVDPTTPPWQRLPVSSAAAATNAAAARAAASAGPCGAPPVRPARPIGGQQPGFRPPLLVRPPASPGTLVASDPPAGTRIPLGAAAGKAARNAAPAGPAVIARSAAPPVVARKAQPAPAAPPAQAAPPAPRARTRGCNRKSGGNG